MSNQISKATKAVQDTVAALHVGARQLFKSTKKKVKKGVKKVHDFFFDSDDSFETYNNDHRGKNLILSDQQANERAFVAARSTNNSVAMRRTADEGAPTASATVEVVSDNPDQVLYRVKRGDTLHQIARAHGSSVEALMNENNLQSPETIYPNQQLRIPSQDPTPGPRVDSSSADAEPPLAKEQQVVVQEGETLLDVSRRVEVHWRELARANQIQNPSKIFPGQVLKVPSTDSEKPTNPAPAPRKPSFSLPLLGDDAE